MKFNIKEDAKERVILCAHRGVWGGNIPCNNILAYNIAVNQGADMIEIDVTKAGDGELFIFHPGMEPVQFRKNISIKNMNSDEIRELRYVNFDGAPTEIGLNTLDEVLEEFKGRCYINIDKFGDNPAEIIEKVKRHDMKDQIILKCNPKPEQLDIIEKYAPDIQFLPVISADNGIHEHLKHRNINYIGSELLFTTEQDECGTKAYRDMLHNDGKLCWVNTIVYNYKDVLSAKHSDDTALEGDPEYGWGWCADNFDIIQTDWIGALSAYLEKTGRRFK
ncbi:MAG: glycerophosphodiester phosphodiesterase family protein [Clostridiales bacterium]|nr:glycerophosphodiester phosphodiesterase family protein [Clostridiales bacterium]